MAETTLAASPALTEMEVRSIDYVPPSERHGRVRDQFTLWFAANMTVLAVLLGAISVAIVGNFFWGVLSFAIGTLLGLLFVGFHAMQGPTLGIPQMIQSRAQFGFYGAVFVLVCSIVLDFGYLAAQLVVQAEAMNVLIPGVSVPVWIVIAAVPVALIALYGYDWVHRWQRWMTVVLALTFVVVAIQTLTYGGLPHATSGFHAPAFALFMGVIALAATNSLSWAPYVSDYSRYLPENVNPVKMFTAVVVGISLPLIVLAALGAYLGSLLPSIAGANVPLAIRHVAGAWSLPIMAISLIGADVLNVYTGMLALATIADMFKDVRHKLSTRVVGCGLLLVAGVIAGLLGYNSFVAKITEFLGVLLFVFIPWSVINLTDYYLVRRKNYDIPSFFTPHGQYKGFLWRGLIPYLIAVGLQVPFLDQQFYTGPLVKSLGGVDISWIVGGVAGFVLYMIAVNIGRPRAVASADKSAGLESAGVGDLGVGTG